MGQDGIPYRRSFHSDRDLQGIMFQLFDQNNETVPERKSVSMPERKSVSDRSLIDGFEAPRNSIDLSAELMELRRQSNNPSPRNDDNKDDNEDEFISIGFTGPKKKTEPLNPPSRLIQQQHPMSRRHMATSSHESIPMSFPPPAPPPTASSTPCVIARLMGLNNIPHDGDDSNPQTRSKKKRYIPAVLDRPDDWPIDRSNDRPVDRSHDRSNDRSNNRASNNRPNEETTTTAMANLSRRRPPTPPNHHNHLNHTNNNSYINNGSFERRRTPSNDGFLQDQAGLMRDSSSSASPTGRGSSARYLYDSDTDSQWVNNQEEEGGFGFREQHPQEEQLQEFKKQFANSLTTSHVATSPNKKLGFRNGSVTGSPSSSCASTNSIKDYRQMRKHNDNQNNHSISPSYSSSSSSTASRHLKNLKSLSSLDDLNHTSAGTNSVEMVDALEFLRANRDFFLSVLQDPATETQHRQESSGLEPQVKKGGSSRSSSPAKQHHPSMGSRSSSPLKHHVTRQEAKGGGRSTSPAKHNVATNGPDHTMVMGMSMGMSFRSISPVKHQVTTNGHVRMGSRSTSPAKHHTVPMNGHSGLASRSTSPAKHHVATTNGHGGMGSRSTSPAQHHAAPTNGHGSMGNRSTSPAKHHAAPTNGHGGMASRSTSPAKHHATMNGHHLTTNGQDTMGMDMGMGMRMSKSMGMGKGNSRSTSPAKQHVSTNGHPVSASGRDAIGMDMGMGIVNTRSTSPLKRHVNTNVPDVCSGSNISTNHWPSSGSIGIPVDSLNQFKHNYKHHPMQQLRSTERQSTNYHSPNEEKGMLGSNSYMAGVAPLEQSMHEDYVDPKMIAKEIVKQAKQDSGNRKVSHYFRHISTSLDIKTARPNCSVGEASSAASTDSEGSCGSSSSRRSSLKSMQNSPQNGVVSPSIKLVSHPNNTAFNPSSSSSSSSSSSPSPNLQSTSDDRIQKRQAAIEEIKLAKLRAAVEEVQMGKNPTFEINLSLSHRFSVNSANLTDDQSVLNYKNKNKQTSPIISNSLPTNPISEPVVKPILPSATTSSSTSTSTTTTHQVKMEANTITKPLAKPITPSTNTTHQVKMETNPAILKSHEKLLTRPGLKDQFPEVYPASNVVSKRKMNINLDFKAKLSSLKDSLVMNSRRKIPGKKKLLSSLSSVTGSMKEATEFPAPKESSSPRLLKSCSAKWPHSSEIWIPTTNSTSKASAHANISVESSLTSVHISKRSLRDPTENATDQSSLEKCDQQPSPVSVLDQVTFLEAIGSSPLYTQQDIPQMNGSRCHPKGRIKSSERVARSEQNEQPSIINIEDMLEAIPRERRPDLTYIRDVLLYCGFSANTSKLVRSFSSTNGLNPNLFQRIEEAYCLMDSEEDSTATAATRGSKWRKLLFDMVDECLLARLAMPTTNMNQWTYVEKPSFHYMRTGKQLLYHIWMDLNSCPFYSSSSAKEVVRLDKLMALDMSKGGAEAWEPMGTDMATVGLEVERVIFNDLAQQLVSDCLSTLKTGHTWLRPRP